VTKSPRLYILFRTAYAWHQASHSLTFYRFVWLSGAEFITLYSDWLNTRGLVGPRSSPRLTRGQPSRSCDQSARRPLQAPCCSCWGSNILGATTAHPRAGIATVARHWSALLSLTTGQGIAPGDSRHWEGCIVRQRSHLAYIYCSAQPCLASSQSLAYLL